MAVEDKPPQRNVTEKRLVQIDFSRLIPELFAVSPDSQHVAYGARAEQKQVVIVDGQAGKPYQAILGGTLRFQPGQQTPGVWRPTGPSRVFSSWMAKRTNPMRRSALVPCALARIASALPTSW